MKIVCSSFRYEFTQNCMHRMNDGEKKQKLNLISQNCMNECLGKTKLKRNNLLTCFFQIRNVFEVDRQKKFFFLKILKKSRILKIRMVNFSVFSKKTKWTRHEWQEKLKSQAIKRYVRKLKKEADFWKFERSKSSRHEIRSSKRICDLNKSKRF